MKMYKEEKPISKYKIKSNVNMNCILNKII